MKEEYLLLKHINIVSVLCNYVTMLTMSRVATASSSFW